MRRIFGFEKVKKREIKEKDLFKSEYLDAKDVARILITLLANVNRLETDMNWVKRLFLDYHSAYYQGSFGNILIIWKYLQSFDKKGEVMIGILNSMNKTLKSVKEDMVKYWRNRI